MPNARECCRFFFLVEEENTPLSITVTPCGSLVDWSLEVHDIPQEFSGAYSGAYVELPCRGINLQAVASARNKWL